MDINVYINITLGLFNREIYMDMIIKEWINQLVSPLFDHIFIFVTQFGSPLAFTVLGLLTFIYLLAYKKWLEGIFLNICLFAAWSSMNYLKDFFGRDRPPGEHLTFAEGFSFPSGHAMLSIAFYGFIAYLILFNWPDKRGKILAALLYVLIFLIGISRIYLNVHYASDVLVGYLFGGIVLFILIKGLKWVKTRLNID